MDDAGLASSGLRIRPRPSVTPDTAFWWDGLTAGELRIQRCTDCTTLRHPPEPGCASCGSLSSDWIVATGAGTVHSHVLVHEPRFEAFPGPYTVALIDLDEGVRLVAGVEGGDVSSGDVAIGMRVRCEIRDFDGLALPVFVPPRPAGARPAEPETAQRTGPKVAPARHPARREDGGSTGTAIAGIGATEFSARSGRSELRLAVEAVRAALDDAGIAPSEVDGLVTFAHDSSPEVAVARSLGIGGLSFTDRVQYGGGDYCATVAHAAMAVRTGMADVVVCYRAFNERSGQRYGLGFGDKRPLYDSADEAQYGWSLPFGLLNAAGWIGMWARRYMHETGATSADFGRVTVAARRHAATNPAARFHGRPITLEDHAASRWITEPLRLLDCCMESDGAVAVVVTSVERARDLRQRPAVIATATQAAGPSQHVMADYYRDSVTDTAALDLAARRIWERSGLGPDDVQAAILYDHFSPAVLAQLESFGFCGRGEAAAYVADVGIGVGDRMAVNPHGGLLGEAYIHGMNGLAEAVRQIRGTSVNQVPGARHVLCSSPPGLPASAVLLASDG
ncbi:thiolase C-terminal domain-containing protein [Actinomadura xylanilytica]|uniref:thiolase C-terminal domain-containing protein n=1 Tax=Actinomadura xylanilytica TaxID=887459 RepID=UPI0032E37DF1